MKKSLLAAAVAATLGLAGVSAQATSFYYDAYGGFVEPPPADGMTPAFGTTVEYGGYTSPDGSRGQVAWGVPTETGGDYAGKSYMNINDNDVYKYAPGKRSPADPRLEVVVGGGYQTFGDLTHINFPISLPANDGKGWVNVAYTLDLYAGPNDADGSFLHQVNLGPFILDIWETANDGTCPNAAPAGTTFGTSSNSNTFESNGTPASNCDDAHAFGPIEAAVGSFGKYSVFAEGFYDANQNLTSTFWSGEEGQSPTGYVGFRIVETTVPEPGSMALLGLGLAGLGLVRRRRNQA